MQFLALLSIVLLICQSWAFRPEFKTSSPGFHRRRVANVFATDGYKLPTNARPISYEVTLTFSTIEVPDEDFGFPSYTFDGEVLITLDVDPSSTHVKTTSLQLNADVDWDSEVPPTFVWNGTMNCELSTSLVTFVEIVCPESIEGEKQTLKITYTSRFSANDEYGLYNFNYTDDGVEKNMIATQLEQDYARRLFPCFDEPEYKAPITLSLKMDTSKFFNWTRWDKWVSNSKVANEIMDGSIKTTTFEPTPKMSAYLLAFVGTIDFKNYTSTYLKEDAGYDFEVFARPSAEKFVSVALESGPQLIDKMGEFTGILYKDLGNTRMILSAIPEFTSGAMENWGLITFREQYLIDEGTSTTARDKQQIIQVIAHELSHQWFGDYVTLDWWSEAWLNEGFATYFEYHLTDQVYSDFDMPKQFVVKEKQQALKTDGYPDAIPLSNNASNVTSNADFLGEFGDISYQKGASIVQVLHQTLGDEAFKTGLHTYLNDNKLGNPSAQDLLTALQTVVPKEQNLDLKQLFKEWIYESGYPLLDVSLDDKNQVTIKATKFSSSLNKTQENNTAIWWIPLTCTTSEKPDFDTISFSWMYSNDLSKFSVTLPEKNDSWIIFNLQSIGYYRVNYDQTLWDRIINVLNNPKTYTTIDVLNRAQLIDDIFNVAKSYQTTVDDGNLYYATAFKLIEYLQYETEYHPWYTFFTEMQYLLEIIQDDVTRAALSEKILKLVSPHVVIPKDTDQLSHTEILTRNLLLTWACRLGHEECTKWAKEQFVIHKTSQQGDTNYRDVVTCTGMALTNTSRSDFIAILNIVQSSDLPSQQSDLIRALTCTSKDYLLQQLLVTTLDYTPNGPPFSRVYNDKIITTLMSEGYQKIKAALNFVLTYDNDIQQYWQAIEDPETLFTKIATKVYNQKHVDLINVYIAKNEPHSEYAARVKAAKEAIEIAKENIEYLDQYKDILASVIIDDGTTTASPTTTEPSTTPGGAHQISCNILLATVLALLLKYVLC